MLDESGKFTAHTTQWAIKDDWYPCETLRGLVESRLWWRIDEDGDILYHVENRPVAASKEIKNG